VAAMVISSALMAIILTLLVSALLVCVLRRVSLSNKDSSAARPILDGLHHQYCRI
jgi:hypothetical protein